MEHTERGAPRTEGEESQKRFLQAQAGGRAPKGLGGADSRAE